MKQTFLKNLLSPNLRILVLFTLILIVIYRISFWMPLPGVTQEVIAKAAAAASERSEPWAIVFPKATENKKDEAPVKE